MKMLKLFLLVSSIVSFANVVASEKNDKKSKWSQIGARWVRRDGKVSDISDKKSANNSNEKNKSPKFFNKFKINLTKKQSSMIAVLALTTIATGAILYKRQAIADRLPEFKKPDFSNFGTKLSKFFTETILRKAPAA